MTHRQSRYQTPDAARRAITDMLRADAGPWPLADLQRQYAYDQLDDALALVKPFLDPLLGGFAAGVWDSTRRAWLAVA